MPITAVDSIHVFGVTGNHADVHATAGDFAISGNVGTHPEEVLCTTGMATEASDHFVEYQHNTALFRECAQFL